MRCVKQRRANGAKLSVCCTSSHLKTEDSQKKSKIIKYPPEEIGGVGTGTDLWFQRLGVSTLDLFTDGHTDLRSIFPTSAMG